MSASKDGLPELPPPDWKETRPTTNPKVCAHWYERASVEAIQLAAYQAGLARAEWVALDECAKQMQMGAEHGGEWDNAVSACSDAIAAAIRAGKPNRHIAH